MPKRAKLESNMEKILIKKDLSEIIVCILMTYITDFATFNYGKHNGQFLMRHIQTYIFSSIYLYSNKIWTGINKKEWILNIGALLFIIVNF